MALPGGGTPEPDGDRPAAFDITGDVWQRQGPLGTPTWWCAAPQAGDPLLGHGRTWVELDGSVLGPMTPLSAPRLPEPPYTGSIPAVSVLGPLGASTGRPAALAALVDAVTDPIPVGA